VGYDPLRENLSNYFKLLSEATVASVVDVLPILPYGISPTKYDTCCCALLLANTTGASLYPMSSSDDSNDDDDDRGEQIRISLTLASECRDKSLQVANLPSIAVPADVGRKGLSAVVNHLLDRRLLGEDEMEDDDRLAAIPFDFIVGGANSTNRRLLRTGIEREARRSGLSLEEAIPVTYFPAQEAPELFGE